MPVPLRLIFCKPLPALSYIVIAPFLVPLVEGVKLTLITQLPPGFKLALVLQVFACVKSTIVLAMFAIFNGALPVFASLTVCARLVVPTA